MGWRSLLVSRPHTRRDLSNLYHTHAQISRSFSLPSPWPCFFSKYSPPPISSHADTSHIDSLASLHTRYRPCLHAQGYPSLVIRNPSFSTCFFFKSPPSNAYHSFFRRSMLIWAHGDKPNRDSILFKFMQSRWCAGQKMVTQVLEICQDHISRRHACREVSVWRAPAHTVDRGHGNSRWGGCGVSLYSTLRSSKSSGSRLCNSANAGTLRASLVEFQRWLGKLRVYKTFKLNYEF